MIRRKVVLRCNLSPGDIVMLTAAVRDLHRSHPDCFITDVRTRCPQLWENNPFITAIEDGDAEAEIIDCEYPLINQCNQLPYHCLHGFRKFLAEKLKVSIPPTAFRGDVHLAPIEKRWMSQVHELTGQAIPFWIVVAGGKFDISIKWWDPKRFQRVVDHFHGKIQFVQVGQKGHHHPALENVIDLRGKTDLRQLIRLTHHSQGVLCPVTFMMHLAAAVETRPGTAERRPCVVIAGGREPTHWEAYPHHQFVHTIGALKCCATGGCWKAHTHPPSHSTGTKNSVCVDVTGDLPRCMDMITAEEIIHRIERYQQGGAIQYLTKDEFKAGELAVQKTAAQSSPPLTIFTARGEAEKFIRTLEATGPAHQGRGIVIPAGGPKYLPCVWVCINMLRKLGCQLPIELWHLGPEEVPESFKSLVKDLGVSCVDAYEVRKLFPARILNGWELKAYSILRCRFNEVLLLDADNVPVVNPEFLFETAQFKERGAVFWPDYGRLASSRSIWTLCGIPFVDEAEFESGQILVNKAQCWRALRLALWYNENSDFFYHYIHGDKDTFHMAFRKLEQPYAMPATVIHSLDGTMCQHDFEGRRIFQHRNSHKWVAEGPNRRIKNFLFEEECLAFLQALSPANIPQPLLNSADGRS
jgi:ADP-heptose:LPS heptosyltransferase